MTADEALARENDTNGQTSAVDEACDWLRDALADGPRPCKQMKDNAKADGISNRTLERARAKTGVIAEPDGFGGPWMWRLPDSASVRQHIAVSAKDESLANTDETTVFSEKNTHEVCQESTEFAKEESLANSGETGEHWRYAEAAVMPETIDDWGEL